MRKGIGGILVAVALLAAPVAAARSGESGSRSRDQSVKSDSRQSLDLEQLRHEFLERLGQFLTSFWLETRGSIEPALPMGPGASNDGDLQSFTSSACGDGTRGTLEPPPGCG